MLSSSFVLAGLLIMVPGARAACDGEVVRAEKSQKANAAALPTLFLRTALRRLACAAKLVDGCGLEQLVQSRRTARLWPPPGVGIHSGPMKILRSSAAVQRLGFQNVVQNISVFYKLIIIIIIDIIICELVM